MTTNPLVLGTVVLSMLAIPSAENMGSMEFLFHRQAPAAEAPSIDPKTDKTIRWGTEKEGIQVGIRLESQKAVFAPGEAIWQEAYLRNGSQREVVLPASSGFEKQGAPVITDGKRHAVKVLRYFGIGGMHVVETRVKPGETARVGRYVVTFQKLVNGEVPKEVAPGISHLADDSPLALAGVGAYTLKQSVNYYYAADRAHANSAVSGAISVKIGSEPKNP